MGYAHYWSSENEVSDIAWKKIVEDTRKLVAAFGHSVELEVGQEVEFALSTDCCETLVLTKAPMKSRFCKTFHYPPDRLVCAILSVAAAASPDIHVSSDARMGSRPDGWPEATRWASKVLGYKVVPPWKYRHRSMWQRLLEMAHLR